MVEKTIRAVEDIALYLGVVAIIMIMMIVSADAVMRYAINRPLIWSYDLIALYLMVVAVFLPTARTYREGNHIGMNIFVLMMSPRVKLVSDIFVSLLMLGFIGVLLWAGWGRTMETLARGELKYGIINYPVWLSHLPVAVGSAALLLRVVHHLAMLFRFGRDPYVITEGEATE